MASILWLFFVCLTFATQLFSDEETEKIFTNIYATGAWGFNDDGIGSSGADALLENSFPYIDFIQEFLTKNKIQSVLDVGCGDWSFSKAINWGTATYTGMDIVKSVIERNHQLFSTSNVSFIHGDMSEVELPKADLLICKDVLQYLPKNKIISFLNRTNQFRYCLFITDVVPDTFSIKNKSIVTGDYRPLDLTEAPFQVNGIKIFKFLAGNSVKQVLLKINSMNSKQQKSQPGIRKKCFVINQVHPYQGFFSVFLTVMNYLDLYDKNDIDGLVVDFQNHGLFYEDSYGSNFWNYYFNPIQLGFTSGPQVDFDYSVANETGRVAYLAEIGLSRQRISELMQKYIHVKPAILEDVERFAADNFQNKFMIGVHYRGTDKSGEALRVSYEDVRAAVINFVNQNEWRDFAIYVATDEVNFLRYMEENFEGKIISQNCLRSSDQSPVHYFNSNKLSPYKTGKEALMDCILLSKCQHLIKTSSCLSLVSLFFNLELPFNELNKRNTHCYKRF